MNSSVCRFVSYKWNIWGVCTGCWQSSLHTG